MPIVGADLGMLSQLVTKLGGPDKHALDDALSEMDAAVQGSSKYWIGDDADGFRSDFAKFAASVTRDLEQVVLQAAQITGQNLNAIAKATGEQAGSSADDQKGTLNGPGAGSGTSGTAGELGAVLAGAVLTGAGGGSVNQPQVNAAIAYFNAQINATVPRFGGGRFDFEDTSVGAQEVLQNWEKLSPADLNAVLQSLSPQQLQELDDAIQGATPDVQQQFAQLILKEADLGTIEQIESNLPDMPLEPPLPSGSKSYQPLPAGSTLFGNGIDPNSQVNQGGIGDCYFLSSLAAVASADPSFIESHIKENANGTYTVTLYQNGKPVDITVLPDLPSGANAADNLPDDGAVWVAVYEKAYAQLEGGYGSIGNGGWSQDVLPTLTGQPASSENWNNSSTLEQVVTLGFGGHGSPPPSLASIQTLLAKNQPVTASTTGNDVWPPGDTNGTGQIEVVGDHVYRVQSVTTDPQTGQLQITLINPWGPDANWEGMDSVTLTQAQFDQYFRSVAW
jgi:uncharacterized protein YukE